LERLHSRELECHAPHVRQHRRLTGNVTVNAGTLDVRNTAALGTKAGTRTTVAAGASLVLGATSLNFQGEQVTVSGTGADGLGVIKNTSGAQLQNAFDKVILAGNVSFPVTKWVRIYTPTTWAGGSGGTGMTQKLGAGTLTLKGTHDWSLGTTHEVREGTEILDGATLTSADAVRVLCTAAGGTARLSLINGSSVTVLLGTANLRLGYAGGNATATNILDVGGTLTLPAGNTGGKVMMGDSSTANTINLNAGGNLLTAAIQDTNATATDVVNCNGGKLTVILDSTNTAATGFMQGLNAVNILDGGLVIDTNGNPALINQAMQAGGTNSGGLTKQGAGTLALGGAKVPLNRTTGHFTYTRRDPALTLLTYGIEKSTTLAVGGWALDNGATQNVISTVDKVQTVEVTLSGTPPLADPTLFVRVVAKK
jgi:hypothetical protein